MSKRTVVIITDDLNENKLASTCRTFALDDKVYELDLSDGSSAHLDDVFAEFIAAAVRVPELHSERSLRDDPGFGGLSKREYNTRMRAWAEAEGRGDEITGKHNGSMYYAKRLRDDYAAHLRQLAADQVSS